MPAPARSVRVLSALLSVAALSSCRDPAELEGAITAILVVVDVDGQDEVALQVADLDLVAAPKRGDEVVLFSLPLAPGSHTGALTVVEVEDDDDGALRERVRACGPVTIVVPDDASSVEPVLTVVAVDDLPECREDEGDDENDDVVEDVVEVEGEQSDGEP